MRASRYMVTAIKEGNFFHKNMVVYRTKILSQRF